MEVDLNQGFGDCPGLRCFLGYLTKTEDVERDRSVSHHFHLLLLFSLRSGPTPGSIFVPNRISGSQSPPPGWAVGRKQRFPCVSRRHEGGTVSRCLKIQLEYGFVLGNTVGLPILGFCWLHLEHTNPSWSYLSSLLLLYRCFAGVACLHTITLSPGPRLCSARLRTACVRR